MAFYALDLETTGLAEEVGPDAERDYILELGVGHYDDNLDLVDRRVWFVGDAHTLAAMERIQGDDAVPYTMHQRSGLWNEWMKAYESKLIKSAWDVQALAIEWFHDHGLISGREPMVGSSIHFDRERFLRQYMPKLNRIFHYRNIDVSTMTETMKKRHPARFEQLRRTLDEYNKNSHRTLDDIHDSINVLRVCEGMEPRYDVR